MLIYFGLKGYNDVNIAMGIPKYYSHVIKKYRNVLSKLTNSHTVNNIYFDSNSIIYDAVREIAEREKQPKNFEDAVIKETIIKLENYISCVNPDGHVMIAFDGVAPRAKMCQQLTRRTRSHIERNIFESVGKSNNTSWDTTAITPGTSFMDKLGKKITSTFSTPSRYSVKKIIVSTSDEPGEGEQKIFQYIRDNSKYHGETKSAIYGLDADLIMLSLNHLHISKGLYLYRETPQFIKSIDSSLEPNCNYVLNMNEMGNAITLELNDGSDINNESQRQRLYDYIFICFLLGNDFLPHFPALNIRTDGIDRITSAYKQTISSHGNITNGDNIVWKNMRAFFNILSTEEGEFFRTEHSIRDKQAKTVSYSRYGDDPIMSRLNNIPLLDRTKEQFIDPFSDGWQERYYKCLFDSERNDELCKSVSLNYISGLEWTLKYYTSGCPDWDWHYKYEYPPLLEDLKKYVPYFDVDFFSESNHAPVHPLTQLTYVIPPSCFHLLPKELNNLIIKEKSTWVNDVTYNVEYSYCRYFWEGHVIGGNKSLHEVDKLVKEYIKI
jgi:5'-3' exonuclease